MTRILGLDVGARRIGVAMSDPLGITAQRLALVERRGPRQDVAAIVRLAQEHHAEAIVVGLPLTMRGEVGEQATLVMAFAESLKTRAGLPVHMMDERLTTAQSERALLETDTSRRKRKGLIDQLSAQLILQAYLDGHANTTR